MRAEHWLLALWAAIGCTAPQAPPVMAELSEVRSSPASVQAEQWAPQAHAHALALEREANAELKNGDAVAAQILSEHALAAHEHAWVLTRLARAEQRRIAAGAELADKQREIAELGAQQQRLSGEAAGLELQAKVLRGALPLPAHGSASPERRAARALAAGALATQARLLCIAAGMLGGQAAIAGELAELDQLDADLPKRVAGDLLERAMRLRTTCLSRMAEMRQRAPGTDAPQADGLLSELSRAGATPSRDDRGVVVVVRDLFQKGGALSAGGQETLERLAGVAKAHPQFPLLVVGHAASARAEAEVQRQLELVKAALLGLGAAPAGVHNAGVHQPISAGQSLAAQERNARIDFVFVAPGA